MKNVKILDFSVGGINHPLVNIHCIIHKSNKLKLIVDKKEIELIDNEEVGTNFVDKLLQNKEYIEYKYKALIPKDAKKLILYEVIGKKEVLVLKEKVDINRRVMNGIMFKLKNITRKVRRLPKTMTKTFILLWKRHHFLVPPRLWGQYFKSFFGHISDSNIYEKFIDPLDQSSYLEWIHINKKQNEKILDNSKEFSYKPLISIVVPVYNVKEKLLSECIESVLRQTYDNFELCLADDCSTLEETKRCLMKYEKKDKRIKVIFREKNGHISAATNSAISISSGEFIGLLDNDDVLSKHALYEVVKVLNDDKNIDMIYTDEDKIALNNKRYFPHFKSDFAPDSLLSSNYICHFTVLRKSIVEELGGFRSEYDGSQDYDMFLRFTEKTDRIYHIPKILYHWRMIEGSTSNDASSKNYAYLAGKKALEDAFKRRNISAKVNLIGMPQMYEIEYLYDKEPKISIIIPTKDKVKILSRCIESIYEQTNYKNYEIIVVNNNSCEEETFQYLNKCVKDKRNFTYFDLNCEFNYSYINNEAVKRAKGEYIVLLNNDTEVISGDWLSKMVGYAMQKHIGCVGAKLLYPTKTIQHCGVVLGCAGIAAHAFIGSGLDNYGYFGKLVAVHDWGAVTAACLMIKKSKFLEVDGLDERLKVAYNDVDLNMKLLDKGYYNIVIPSVVLFHYESISRGNDFSKENKARFVSEVKYMTNKWGKEKLIDKFYNNNLSNYFPYYLDREKTEIQKNIGDVDE